MKGLITKAKAREILGRYDDQRGKLIKDNVGFEDHKEFVFSLERLKQYIAKIEEHAQEEGYSDLGLRIYLGAYKKNGDENKCETTVFFVPTAKNASQKQNNINAKNRELPEILNTVTTNALTTSDDESTVSDGNENENIYTMSPMNLAGSGRPPAAY